MESHEDRRIRIADAEESRKRRAAKAQVDVDGHVFEVAKNAIIGESSGDVYGYFEVRSPSGDLIRALGVWENEYKRRGDRCACMNEMVYSDDAGGWVTSEPEISLEVDCGGDEFVTIEAIARELANVPMKR